MRSDEDERRLKRARQAEQPSAGADAHADADAEAEAEQGANAELRTPEGSPLAAAVWEHGLEVWLLNKRCGGVGVQFLAKFPSCRCCMSSAACMLAAAGKQLCVAAATACSCTAPDLRAYRSCSQPRAGL